MQQSELDKNENLIELLMSPTNRVSVQGAQMWWEE